MCVCVCACVRACACVYARARARVCVCACVCVYLQHALLAMLTQLLSNSVIISPALPATCFVRAHFRHVCGCVGVLIDRM